MTRLFNAGARDMKPVESTKLQRTLAMALRKRFPSPPFVAVLPILALLFHALPLHAQIEWTPEAQISLDDVYDDRLPQIASGPDGKVWVVWTGFDGYDREVLASTWNAEAWSLPVRVNSDNSADDVYPDVAVGPDGNVWVVWTTAVSGGTRLYYARWAGDGWEQEELVFPELEDEPGPGSPVLEVDSWGTPWLIWSWWPPDQGSRELFYSRWLAGAWSDAQPFSEEPGPGDVGGRDLATGENGEVWVMWVRSLGSPTWESVSLYTHWEEDGWAPVDTFPRAEVATQLDIGPDGEVWVAWSEGGDIYSSSCSEGDWSERERITAPDSTWAGQNAGDADAHICVAPIGSPWVSWVGREWGYGDFDQEIYFSHRTGGRWSPEQRISTADGFRDEYSDLAVANDGQAWVVWEGWDGTDREVLTSRSVNHVEGITSQHFSAEPNVWWAPNPVVLGCKTTITRPCPGDQTVVFDLLGRRVRQIECRLSSGRSDAPTEVALVWDCRDDTGELVCPGTYVVHLSTGGCVSERRIVVLK
ncbi:hypothetical protein JXA88_11575 [Candidatus Fermentibacteria bacterium]|nr:hypothetical protein [Candidatus Fermentibacteria bacterium]